MSDSTVRQRKQVVGEDETVSKPSRKEQEIEDDDPYTPWVDILRVLTFLFVASCGLSYLISNGETWFWGMQNPPNYLRAAWWKSQWVRHSHPFTPFQRSVSSECTTS